MAAVHACDHVSGLSMPVLTLLVVLLVFTVRSGMNDRLCFHNVESIVAHSLVVVEVLITVFSVFVPYSGS